MRVLVIAEAGVNHNGDIDLAKKLIEAAASAGADVVKFQTFNADRLVTAAAKKADYQLQSTDGHESQHAMLRKLELSSEMHRILIDHCAACSIGFLSTAFDIESVTLLAALGQKQFKIPSGEITNLPYLRHIGGLRGDVLLSTGMSTMAEIEAALNALEASGTPRNRIVVMHCTTEYPAPMAEVNLRALLSIKERFGTRVGYSDHTSGIEVSIAAAALGASVIEKHFTMSRSLPGPDHKASAEPGELKKLVTAVRNIELALGDGRKQPTPSEARNMEIVRKSLVASRPIMAGEAFSAENIAAKRPGTGISPMLWDDVMGKVAPRNFLADELIEL